MSVGRGNNRGAVFTFRLLEALEVLAGMRGSRSNHAVRFKDIVPMLSGDASIASDRVARLTAEEAASTAYNVIGIAEQAQVTANTADQTANEALANQAETLAFRVQDGSAGALLELIASNDPSGAVSVARIEAQQILLKGSVAVDFLTVGLGRNLLTNTRFRSGDTNWRYVESGLMADESDMAIRAPGQSWSGGLYPTLMIEQTGNATNGGTHIQWYDVVNSANDQVPGVPVQPGDWLEASANISAHRCDVTVHIVWFDVAGAVISVTAADGVATVSDDLGPSDAPDLWERPFVIAQAPAGSAFATIRIVKGPTQLGDANSLCFVHKPQLAISHENATLASAYSEDGNTVIGPGGILTGSLSADDIQAGSMSVAFLTVDQLLSIDAETAGFQMGKESVFDEESDGIFMGRTTNSGSGLGFGFAVGVFRGGIRQQITATEEQGVRATNVAFYRDLNVSAGAVTITSSQTVVLPNDVEILEVEGIGGGGGGASGQGVPGTAGGTTTVELFDGAVSQGVIITSVGGSPGTSSSTSANDQPGQPSAYGENGAGNGGRGGTFNDDGGPDRYGEGGRAAQVDTTEINISALTDPQLVITIGARGDGGSSSDPGDDGGRGQIIYRTRGASFVQADVIPLQPTASGSFFKNGDAAFDFPDLGPGMWIIWRDNDAGLLDLLDVEISDANQTVRVNSEGTTTFVASKTPRCLGGDPSNRDVRYLFYKMGDA